MVCALGDGHSGRSRMAMVGAFGWWVLSDAKRSDAGACALGAPLSCRAMGRSNVKAARGWGALGVSDGGLPRMLGRCWLCCELASDSGRSDNGRSDGAWWTRSDALTHTGDWGLQYALNSQAHKKTHT